jgi:hypothetical protein
LSIASTCVVQIDAGVGPAAGKYGSPGDGEGVTPVTGSAVSLAMGLR